jgi:hypothetical protein
VDRFRVINAVLSVNDLHILQEALWHAGQRGDLSDEDRARVHELREKLKEYDAS